MSYVFLATETTLGRQIVVKVLPPDAAAAMSAERFKREIQVAARLQHPHIVPLLLAGDANGLPFYTMPYVRGESLRARLNQQGELGINEAVHILRDVASALAHAHDEGVVHRDIKPENVILTGGVAVVADFGIAKARDNATTADTAHASGGNITSLGVALGTPAYMAPEQATADPTVDRRADIYSFGCIAYELLAGSSPFAGRPMQQLLAAHVSEPPLDLVHRRPSVPPTLAALVMKCLEKRPGDRPQSAHDLIAALDAISTPSGGTQPTSARSAAARGPSRRTWYVAGGIAASALGVLAFVISRRPPAFTTYQVAGTKAIATTSDLEGDPAISPDGKLVAYAAGPIGATRIYVRQVDGGRPTLISGDVGGSHAAAAWTPDGTRVSFVAGGLIYVVPALGGTPKRLVDGAESHAWSPDGKEIVYARHDGLWIRTANGGPERQLVKDASAHSPAYSPDGRWIAYASGLTPTMNNISTNVVWIVPARGGAPVRLSDSTRTSVSPVFAPDNRSLLFVSSEGGIRDVYQQPIGRDGRAAGPRVRLTTGLAPYRISISADGRRLAHDIVRNFSNIWTVAPPPSGAASIATATQVTRDNQHIEAMSVSHDRQWIAYDSDRGGQFDIYRQRIDGGEPIQLTTSVDNEFHPVWSPDDKRISFHSQRAGVRQVYTITADGTGETQITHGSLQHFNRAWSPDGRALSFGESSASAYAYQSFFVTQNTDGSWSPPRPISPGPDTIGTGMNDWSPDGKTIAFTHGGAVWLVPADGGNARRLAGPSELGGYAVNVEWAKPLVLFVAVGPGALVVINRRTETVRMQKIVALSVADGHVQTLLEADANHRFAREEFGTDGRRLFFTLSAWERDVGVVELTTRSRE